MDLIENDAINNSSIVAYIRRHGNVFTKPLPSNDRRDIHTGTQTGERDLRSKMGSGAKVHQVS
jgi:hypothetical protein